MYGLYLFYFVYFSARAMQSCGYLLGKGLLLGSPVCGVFFYVLSISNAVSWSGVVLDCIDSGSLPYTFLCNEKRAPLLLNY